MVRLVQVFDPQLMTTRVARVRGDKLELLNYHSTYELISEVIKSDKGIDAVVSSSLMGAAHALNYDAVYNGADACELLAPVDHPEPARCIISGTGLTHLGSAKSRDSMHERIGGNEQDLTDSMKIFRWGVEKGKPAPGQIGIAPEWFYKGTGDNLRGHGDALDLPVFADDGGEEAEIAGVYIIDPEGNPVRIGMAQGNEYSDHVFEKKNYLNLAGSKLRNCAIGPELVIGPEFSSIAGTSTILRDGRAVWSKAILTGEKEMCHSLANIEHHHFKFDGHRRPGDVHVHFYGACALSFADGVKLVDGDVMQVEFEGFGRPLRNTLKAAGQRDELVRVQPIR